MSTIESTSPKRAEDDYSGNVMRHKYRVLNETENQQMQTVKDKGLEFFAYLHSVGTSRELSLAKTKVEEAVMWAVKHITG